MKSCRISSWIVFLGEMPVLTDELLGVPWVDVYWGLWSDDNYLNWTVDRSDFL